MTAQAHDTNTAVRPARRADAGAVRLSQRDIDGLPADAEIHWPGIARIMTGLLSPRWYPQVIYLTAPAARPAVMRAGAALPGGEQSRVVVRELPAAAFAPEAAS
jgi:hypothetical protein